MFAELRYGARYCDGTTLQVGVKCLCKLQSDQSVAYHCHIQEMRPDGPCLVFIEELGEKMVVNYEQLEPLPVDEIKPWAPPYRYSRANSQIVNISQVLQQIGVTILKSINFLFDTNCAPQFEPVVSKTSAFKQTVQLYNTSIDFRELLNQFTGICSNKKSTSCLLIKS